jgi:D-sedoheptulose 7-phosphate isomerase
MGAESTGFLYRFIEADERDAESLLADLAASAEAQASQSRELRADTLKRLSAEIEEIASKMARRLFSGGRLFTFGNGGSATDAACLAGLFTSPPSGRAFPARSLVADQATITALGNDVGFELVFARQLIVHSRPGDVAVGFSTSGNSSNVLTAFAEAHRRGLYTVGLAGYEGGQMAVSTDIDHCLVVGSDSIHRIQETQDAVVLALWQQVQDLVEHPKTARQTEL